MLEDVTRNGPPPLSGDNQPTVEGPYQGPIRRPDDAECGFEILDDFERFNACNDTFARTQWDQRIRTTKAIDWFKSMFRHDIGIRDVEGFQRKDFAIRNAAWVGANLMIERSLHLQRHDGFLDDYREYLPPASTKAPMDSPEDMTAEIKQVARLFGADLVGITSIDLRWHYTHRFSAKTLTEKPNDVVDGLENVIVIGTAMPGQVVKTVPSALSGTAAGFGYSKDALTLMSISQFIRNLGYRAVASLNDTAQCVPYAIQAGLGEYGRHGLVITEEFGPRLRFGKIYTDLPLVHDKPKSFGVKAFCEICRRCSDACPPQAIPSGEPQDKIINQSNFVGIRKWSVDGEKCFKFWANQGTDCSICIRVCPYNKDSSRWLTRLYYQAWRRLAATRLRRFALWLDVTLGFGERLRPSWWWSARPGW